MKNLIRLALMAAMTISFASCANDDPNPEKPVVPDVPPVDPGEDVVYEPGETPSFSYSIAPWDGTVASDITDDNVNPADEDTYHENNAWEQVISVRFDGDKAEVTGNSAPVTFTVDGAHVNLNLSTVKARVNVTGESADGSLRIVGEKRHMLNLCALNLKSSRGPAINDQDKKRVFVNLEGDSYLEDSPEYAPADNPLEDRKGCFFAEGHVILSGDGVLQISGRQRHGLASDGYLIIRPGVTLVVNDAAKNAIHAKGGNTTGYGIIMMGGYVYANTSAPAGKVLKSDLLIDIRGGKLDLNCSGAPAVDPDDNTLSSSACIKTDGALLLRGADASLTAVGNGGKGLNITGSISVSGGCTTIACTGIRMEDNNDSATPKAVKTDGNFNMLGGVLNVSAIGDGSVGVEVLGSAVLQDGVIYAFGCTEALHMVRNFALTGGTMVAGGGALSVPTECTGVYYKVSDLSVTAPGKMVLVASSADVDERVCATFDWPVAMTSPAEFIFWSPEVTTDLTYDPYFLAD